MLCKDCTGVTNADIERTITAVFASEERDLKEWLSRWDPWRRVADKFFRPELDEKKKVLQRDLRLLEQGKDKSSEYKYLQETNALKQRFRQLEESFYRKKTVEMLSRIAGTTSQMPSTQQGDEEHKEGEPSL